MSGYSSAGADQLIEDILAATDRETLNDATRALDRLLRAEIFGYHSGSRKTTLLLILICIDIQKNCLYDLGTLDFWWFDEAAYNITPRLKALFRAVEKS